TTAAAVRDRVLAGAAPQALAVLGVEAAATVDAAAIGRGVHVPTWIARDVAALIEQYAGRDWRERQDDESWWQRAEAIPGDQLWAARQRLRGYLLDFVRERARRRWTRDPASGPRLVGFGTLLDP